jgi:TP901 family phage tail tape measure protein
MGLLGEMRVVFSADTSSLTSGAQAASNSLLNVGAAAGASKNVLNAVRGILVNVGEDALQAGAQAVQMAGNFQSGMTTLVTGAGEAQSNLKLVSDGILQVAQDTGTATKNLTDGMYMIESAGYHGKQGLDVLKDAAEGAQVGNAKLSVVANGVTTIMTDYASTNITASQATNTLIATTANGKTTMQALSTAMSTILPASSAVGVSLNDTAGAMATMTGEGTSAAQASTYLRQLLMALTSPAKAGADALKSIGLTSEQVSNEMKVSLPETLKMITDHLKAKFPEGSQAYINALKDISGGSKQMQGMLELTGTHLQTFEGNVKNVSDAVKKGGGDINGWSLVQQNFNTQVAQAHEKMEVLGIKIGTALLPAVMKLMDKISPLISQFVDWLDKSGALKNGVDFLVGTINNMISTGSTVVDFFKNNAGAMEALKAGVFILAGAILGAMVPALITMAIAAWAAIVPLLPFIAIGALVGLVIFGIVEAVIHWGQIAHWLQGVWGALVAWLSSVWGGFSKWFMQLWSSLIAWIQGFFGGVGAFFQQAWAFILSIVQTAGQMILLAIIGPFLLIGAAFVWLYGHNVYVKQLVDTVVGFFVGLKDRAIAIITYWTQWLNAQWAALQMRAAILWKQISDAIMTPINAARNYVIAAISYAHNYLAAKWAEMQVLAQTAWNRVSQVFSQAWNTYISKPLSAMWNNVSNWWNNTVIGGMRSFGGNMMHAIANGVSGAAGAVGDAIHSAISNALSSMGFHDIPGFTLPGHAQGILNSPVGHWAIVGEKGPEMMYVPQGSSIYPNNYAPSSSASAVGAGSADNSGDGTGEQHIYIELDGDILTHIVSNKQMRTVRARMARRTA